MVACRQWERCREWQWRGGKRGPGRNISASRVDRVYDVAWTALSAAATPTPPPTPPTSVARARHALASYPARLHGHVSYTATTHVARPALAWPAYAPFDPLAAAAPAPPSVLLRSEHPPFLEPRPVLVQQQHPPQQQRQRHGFERERDERVVEYAQRGTQLGLFARTWQWCWVGDRLRLRLCRARRRSWCGWWTRYGCPRGHGGDGRRNACRGIKLRFGRHGRNGRDGGYGRRGRVGHGCWSRRWRWRWGQISIWELEFTGV